MSDQLGWLWSDESVARVQALGTGWEPFFQVVTVFGVGAVILWLSALLAWWSGDARGYWLLLLLFTSAAVNGLLKALIALDRPDGPDIVPYAISPSSSLPSGHAQASAALAVALILAWRVPAWLAIPPALLVCLSRVYLGLHYPGDVLVGAALGTVLALWFARGDLRGVPGVPTAFLPLALAAVVLVGPLVAHERDVARQCGALAGALIGLTLARQWSIADLVGLPRNVVGISGLLAWPVVVVAVEGLDVGRLVLVAGYLLAGAWLLATLPTDRPATSPVRTTSPRGVRRPARRHARRSGPPAPA